MFRKTIVALAATALLGLSTAALHPTPASAYDDDYCYYHRYDPRCWWYWHHHEDYDDYDHHHHHHGDHDHDHDHSHDHDHDHGDHHGDHDHD
jgi:hypothetical protein